MKYTILFSLLLTIASTPSHAALKNVFGKTDLAIKTAITALSAHGSNVKSALSDFFHAKEQRILKKIKNAYGIIDLSWNQMKVTVNQLISSDHLYMPTGTFNLDPYEHEIIQETRQLIASYGMNPDNVLITENNQIPTAQVSALITNGTLTHHLELNINCLETLTHEQCVQTLKHEIMHMWYQDSLNAAYLCELINNNTLDPLYIEYSKNQELRADIMAAADTIANATMYYNWLNTSEPDDTDDYIHPILSKRIKAGFRLYTYLSFEAC